MKLNTKVNTNKPLKGKVQKINKEGTSLRINTQASTILPIDKGITNKPVSGTTEIKVGGKLALKSILGESCSINIGHNSNRVTVGNLTEIVKNTPIFSPGPNPIEVTFVDDSAIKGGYRVVETIEDRNSIDCCYRKLGMVVKVVEDNFNEYTIRQGNVCDNDNWEILVILDGDVNLEDNYDIFAQNIETQRDLNQVFKNKLLTIPVGGGDKNYIHDQINPSKVWVINHSLNKKVSVTITDTAGTVVEGKVTVNNGSKVTVEFNFPFNGEAILN